MARRDETTLMRDGPQEFPVTSWTLVLNAAEQEKIRETLYGLYWRPLYCLLRHKGFSNEDAKDYTEDFLMQIILGPEFIRKVDKTRAKKFRSFLIKAFLNHVRGKLRKKRERPFHEEDSRNYEPSSPDKDDSTRAFDYEWAVTLLQRVLEEVKSQCHEEGLETHWRVFVDRIVTPMLEGRQAPPLPDVCQKYEISSPCQVSNMIVTVKRRFEKTLVRHLGCHADSPQECREALEDFMSIFSQE